MTDRIDLHVHTLNSDGSDTSTAVVRKAAQLGLRAIAITDHDTFAGIDEATAAGERLGVEVVPGVELSTLHEGEHVHLLAYYADPNAPALTELMALAVRERVQRNEKMVNLLHDAGYPIDMDEMRREYPGQVMLGRPHVAAILMKKGVVPDIRTGVVELMGKGKPFYVERYHIPLTNYIRAVRAAGGLPVIAHLYQYRFTEQQRRAGGHVLHLHGRAAEDGVRPRGGVRPGVHRRLGLPRHAQAAHRARHGNGRPLRAVCVVGAAQSTPGYPGNKMNDPVA